MIILLLLIRQRHSFYISTGNPNIKQYSIHFLCVDIKYGLVV